jgi:hypothetical protein
VRGGLRVFSLERLRPSIFKNWMTLEVEKKNSSKSYEGLVKCWLDP